MMNAKQNQEEESTLKKYNNIFHPIDLLPGETIPGQFTYPFAYTPHSLCRRAAAQVIAGIDAMTDKALKDAFSEGKMLGVLVVEAPEGGVGYLAAFSGNVAGRNCIEGFVPPVYDLLDEAGEFKTGERALDKLNAEIRRLGNDKTIEVLRSQLEGLRQENGQKIEVYKAHIAECRAHRQAMRATASEVQMQEMVRESQFQKAELKRLKHLCAEQEELIAQQIVAHENKIEVLKQKRAQDSALLQQFIFSQFVMRNANGEKQDLNKIFRDYGGIVPPAGAGECAAPKMLQYAFQHGYKPLAMAEFWYGNTSQTHLRQHRHFYPSCHAKCKPILNFMLQGLDVETPAAVAHSVAQQLRVLWQDEHLAAVYKPSGVLSAPGKEHGAVTVAELYASLINCANPLVPHRLDMGTSGIMILAKTMEAYTAMQRLFENREVHKTYHAIIGATIEANEGTITAPIEPDYENRPRQRVNYEAGKEAVTHYRVLERYADGTTLVEFEPHTGRTHQLRVHSLVAFGAPIMGDVLYGGATPNGSELQLKAVAIAFPHPLTGMPLSFKL